MHSEKVGVRGKRRESNEVSREAKRETKTYAKQVDKKMYKHEIYDSQLFDIKYHRNI